MLFALDANLVRPFVRDPSRGATAIVPRTLAPETRKIASTLTGRTVTVGVLRVSGVFGLDPTIGEQIFDGVFSSREFAQRVREMAADPSTEASVIAMNSPGGDAMGLAEIGAAIRAHSAVKPIVGIADAMIASAGMHTMAHVDALLATPDALVGSIGVISTLVDLSEMFKKWGIRFVHVAHGEKKAVGHVGAAVTDEDAAYWGEQTRPFYEQFIASVAAGRGMTDAQARALATGEVWVGEAAVKAGLVDSVGFMANALDLAAGMVGKDRAARRAMASGRNKNNSSRAAGPLQNPALSRKGTIMTLAELKQQEPATYTALMNEARASFEAQNPLEPAATLGELRAAFKDDPEFVLGQLEAGATMTQARAKFGEIAAARAEAKAKADLAKLTAERDAEKTRADKAEATLKTLTNRGGPVKTGFAGTLPGAALDGGSGGGSSGGGGGAFGGDASAEGFAVQVRAYADENGLKIDARADHRNKAISAVMEKNKPGFKAWSKVAGTNEDPLGVRVMVKA